MTTNYAVRAIGSDCDGHGLRGGCSILLLETDDYATAKRIAEERAQDYYYGTAILRSDGLADFGDSKYWQRYEESDCGWRDTTEPLSTDATVDC